MFKLNCKSALAVLFIALALRLALLIAVLVQNPDGIWVYDSYSYWQIGYNLVTYGSYSMSYEGVLDPDVFRTPLYPLLMGFFHLTGTGSYGMLGLQVILSSLTALVVYNTALRLSGQRAALIAGLIIALDIPSIIFANFILTESIFTFLFAASLFQMVKHFQEKSMRSLSWAALLHALAILCRPIATFTFLIFLLFVLFTPSLNKAKWKNALVYSVITLLVLVPWLVRNKIVFDSFTLSTAGSHVLHNYHAADILSRKYNIPFKEAQLKLRLHAYHFFKGDVVGQPVKYADYCRDKAIGIIARNKAIFLRQQTINAFSLMFKPARGYIDQALGYTKGYQSISGSEFPMTGKTIRIFNELSSRLSFAAVIIQLVMLAVIYAGLIFCLWSWRKHNKIILGMMLLLLGYFFNATVPPYTDARLRVPVMPVLAMLGAAGLAKTSLRSAGKERLSHSRE